MRRDRFEALAEAYGARLERWPEREQPEALRFRAVEPESAAAILARAAEMDAALDAWRPLQAGVSLREQVIAAAPAAMRRVGRRVWLWRAGAGVSLAAAGVAGLVVGVALAGSGVTANSPDEPLSAVMTAYDGPASSLGADSPT